MKQKKRNDFSSAALRVAVKTSALVCVAIFLFIVGYILFMGIPHLNRDLFAWQYTSQNLSMMPAIINTLIMTVLTLLMAAPVGIGAAIYLVEYARAQSLLVRIIRTTTQTLSGIPSIVYGLFGYLLFNVKFGWSYSILGGAMTLAIMVLPLIIRTTEEALLAVPESYRQGSFGLGAGKLRTTMQVVLPSAASGVLSGVILAIGRVVGETAALLYTAGTVSGLPENLLSSGRTLAVHMHALLSEGLYMPQAYATAVVLLVVVLLINALSSFAAKKMTKGKNV
ncbi:MAG: phosphate ABC transporter permease PstA [Clostridia bacterium]|nr:phosphate ABC transporter permease PstA [Clostridia bacterium]